MRGIGNIPIVFLSLWIFFGSSLSAQVKISLRNKAYFTVRDFKRIPEFFTGREFTGWKVYCRTNPADREGFYFVVKVTGDVPPLSADCHWLLEWITPLDPTAQQKKVSLTDQKNYREGSIYWSYRGRLARSIDPAHCLVSFIS